MRTIRIIAVLIRALGCLGGITEQEARQQHALHNSVVLALVRQPAE